MTKIFQLVIGAIIVVCVGALLWALMGETGGQDNGIDIPPTTAQRLLDRAQSAQRDQERLAPQSPDEAQSSDETAMRIAFLVGNTSDTIVKVTQDDIDQALLNAAEGQTLPASEIARLRHGVEEDLLTVAVLLSEARRRGIEPDTQTVEQRIALGKAQLRAQLAGHIASDQDRERFLTQQMEKYRSQFEDEVRLDALRNAFIDHATPTADELGKYYQDHQDKYVGKPELGRASWIELPLPAGAGEAETSAARGKVEAIKAAIGAGSDFAQLAAVYSSDADTKQNGGDLGWFERGKSGKGPEFEQVVFKLTDGQVSEPMRRAGSVLIIKRTGTRPQEVRPLEEIRDQVEQDFLKWQWKAWIRKLWTATQIRNASGEPVPMNLDQLDQGGGTVHAQ